MNWEVQIKRLVHSRCNRLLFGEDKDTCISNEAVIYGFLSSFINAFKVIYENLPCCVKMPGGNGDYFKIETGVSSFC